MGELVGRIHDVFDAGELNVMSRLGDGYREVDAESLLPDFNRRAVGGLTRIKGKTSTVSCTTPLARHCERDAPKSGACRLQAMVFDAGALVRIRVTHVDTQPSDTENVPVTIDDIESSLLTRHGRRTNASPRAHGSQSFICKVALETPTQCPRLIA